jgi:hypothetical protein
VARPVVLFVGSGALVLLDEILVVFVNRATGHNANLRVIPHDLSVEKDRVIRIPNKGSAVLETQERHLRLLINAVAIGMRFGRKVDFRAYDVEEA